MYYKYKIIDKMWILKDENKIRYVYKRSQLHFSHAYTPKKYFLASSPVKYCSNIRFRFSKLATTYHFRYAWEN